MKDSISKEDLEKMIFDEKLSYEKIGRKLGVSGNCIKKWAKNYGIILTKRRKLNNTETFNKGRNKWDDYINSLSEEDFTRLLKSENTISDVIKILTGKKRNNSLSKAIKDKCNALNISFKDIKRKKEVISNSDLYSNFTKDSIISTVEENIPGIYIIKNNINSHMYIGQSLNIRRRLLKHLSKNHWEEKEVKDFPLYLAFKKYGIDKFSFRILEKLDPTLDKNVIDEMLDKLEIKYINEYNTYRGFGYNRTKGGKTKKSGYKLSENKIENIRRAAQKSSLSGRYTIWYYDLITKEYKSEVNSRILDKKLGTCNIKRHKTLHKGRYITERTLEKLKESVKEYYEGGWNKSKEI